MNIENTRSQMRKGILEFCILKFLSENEAYPSVIVKFLRESGLEVVEGTIYPLLTRLKNASLLSYRWEESNSGPPRKYYQSTDTGIAFMSQLDETWNQLQKAVNTINKK